MPSNQLIDKHRKCKTLAERGATAGERAAAQAAVERMEAAHPNIAAQARAVEYYARSAYTTTTDSSSNNVVITYYWA